MIYTISNMTSRSFVFFHGGPGFNALAEKIMFSEKMAASGASIDFWREPLSTLPTYNPNQAYQQLVDSALDFLKKKVDSHKLIIVGHSFATRPIIEFVNKVPDKIEKIFFITPTLNLFETDERIFLKSKSDFIRNNDIGRANRLLEMMGLMSHSRFDNYRKEAILLSLQNEILFTNYWRNKDAMNKYVQYFMSDEIGMDAGALTSVRASMPLALPDCEISNIPCHAIFGMHDFIVESEKEIPVLQRYFSNFTYELFSNSGHYPHIEELDKFLNTILG